MMSLLDQLVECSGETVTVRKNNAGKFIVMFEHCDVYDGVGVLGVFGEGGTVGYAVKDYINKISGKRLVFNFNTESERYAKFIFFKDVGVC